MADYAALIDSIRHRPVTSKAGIALALPYVSGTQEFTAATDWPTIIQKAADTLVYHNDGMKLTAKRFDDEQRTAGACMDFDCVITTSRKDRDGDILETGGAEPDPKMPLLWMHNPNLVIGKLISITKHTKTRLEGHFAVADTPLGRDAAQLIEFGAIRISHGFRPIEWEPLSDKDADGFRIKRFEVMETSGVSVPSNTEAVVMAYSRGKLHHPIIKKWAARLNGERTRSISFDGLVDQVNCAQLAGEHAVGAITINDTRQIEATPSGAVAASPTRAAGATTPTAARDEGAAKKLLRWNKTLSEAFDVAAEQLQPATLIYDWVARHIGCELKHVHVAGTNIPSARIGSFLTGLRYATNGYELRDVRGISYSGREVPPRHEVIQLNSKQRDDFLVDGIAFYAAPQARFVLEIEPSWIGLRVTCYTSLEQRDFGSAIIDKAWKWARENNFLKGEAFALSGEFLPKTAEVWDSVFLEEKTEATLKRTLAQLNSKGVSFTNRGILMTGPPGTGKTLSGRILRNEADATFIWVSSRDFYYSGVFGGMSYAFELARELAPAIVFVEDIDNWLNSQSIDLLKTEMDGIARYSGLLTILTTNYPERLPEALIDRPGRFHDVLHFKLPDAKLRLKMLKTWLAGVGEQDLQKAVKETDGYSGAHLWELAQFAKTLQETDGLTLSKALDEAIKKVQEQRDLINDVQLEGSRFQPYRELQGGLMTKMRRSTSVGKLSHQEWNADALATRLVGNLLQGESLSPGIALSLAEQLDDYNTARQAELVTELVGG